MTISTSSELSTEKDILFNLISLSSGGNIKADPTEINSDYFLQIAASYEVIPLVYRQYLNHEFKFLPSQVFEQLRILSSENFKRNLFLSRHILQISNLLTVAGVPFLLYKGIPTALYAYGDIAMRQMIDIDILIQPKDFELVYDIFVKHGWQPKLSLDKRQRKFFLNLAAELAFTRQGDILEVHWKLFADESLYPLTTSEFWARITTLELFDRPLPTMSLEDTVLFTCIHAARHACSSLKAPADLAYLAQSQSSFDWLGLLERARRTGFYRIVCLNLLLSERLLGASFPDAVKQIIHDDRASQKLADEVINRLANDRGHLEAHERFWFYVRCRERLSHRLRLILHQLLFPREADWQTISLPEKLFFLYFIIHPIRMCIGLTKKLVKHHLPCF